MSTIQPLNTEPIHTEPSGAESTATAPECPPVGLRDRIRTRLHAAVMNDDGMSTVEYALGTIAAAAFGALLYTVVTGGDITDALTGIIERALNTDV